MARGQSRPAPSRVETVAGERPGDSAAGVVTSIVLPAYNEADTLGPLVSNIVEVMDAGPPEYRPYEVLVVDDGSTDGTREQLRHAAALYEQVRGLSLGRNFGQSAALAAGFEHAKGEYIVPMDADGQNDPMDIPALLDGLDEGYDCVSGNRVDRDDPWHKTIPSAIQTWLAKATGPDIHDFGCTLKAYRADALEDIHLYGEGHRYIPAQLHKRGYAITERPVSHHPRENGASHYGAGRLLRGFVDLLFHAFWNRYSTRPLHLLGGGGLVLIALGLLVGGHAVVLKYLFEVSLLPRLPRLILTVALLFVGVQCVMFGVLAEMYTKLYYREDCEYRVAEVIE